MSYDHSKKAGNKGDVWKHAVLVEVTRRLPVEGAFRYVESHAGAPGHDLGPGGEWRRGIGKVPSSLDAASPEYLRLARPFVQRWRYPAGWQFAAAVLQARSAELEVELYDQSPEVAAKYPPQDGDGLWPGPPRFALGDGYVAVGDLPRGSAHLVFLDPPFSPNASKDWKALSEACKGLLRRDIPFLAWYPFYWPTRPQWLVDETGQSAWEVAWARCGEKRSQNMKGCGMLASPAVAELLKSAEGELRKIALLLEADLTLRQPIAG